MYMLNEQIPDANALLVPTHHVEEFGFAQTLAHTE